jgi:hypothetical protein
MGRQAASSSDNLGQKLLTASGLPVVQKRTDRLHSYEF